jgi:curved DNA-binding protein CbpA
VRSLSEQTLYEILEVPRSATHQEVQRAYERARAIYGPGSLASYTLAGAEEAEALSLRIEEARSVLLDRQARATYDERLPPEREGRGRPVPPSPEGARSAAPPAAVAPGIEFRPPDGAPWSGDLIRQAREARGLTSQQVSERTKVQRSYVEHVEAERYDQLPPPVYLRGIVLAIASALRLDDQVVAKSYMERAARARDAARQA